MDPRFTVQVHANSDVSMTSYFPLESELLTFLYEYLHEMETFVKLIVILSL